MGQDPAAAVLLGEGSPVQRPYGPPGLAVDSASACSSTRGGRRGRSSRSGYLDAKSRATIVANARSHGYGDDSLTLDPARWLLIDRYQMR